MVASFPEGLPPVTSIAEPEKSEKAAGRLWNGSKSYI